MTIFDSCISLNSVQIFLVVLGVVDMCHLLLNVCDYQMFKQRSTVLYLGLVLLLNCRGLA